MLYHYPSAKLRRETLPVAIVLGALPDINYVAAAICPMVWMNCRWPAE
jgi:hypothetical protein